MKDRVLSLLKNKEGFISGQELASSLGITRSAVWKAVERLRLEGYEIQAVTRKGYRLCSQPDLIDGPAISRELGTVSLGRNVVFLPETDSTNNAARALAEEGCPHGTLVVTEHQTMGKGRRGRIWEAPAGKDIAMSLVLRPDIAPEKASMTTLMMGVAIAKACRSLCSLENVMVKWPNDVVAGGKKLSGTLTELSCDPDQVNYIVVGSGINVNSREFPEDIAATATSLSLETGHDVRRSPIIAEVLNIFETLYEAFIQRGDLSFLTGDYDLLMAARGSKVRVISGSHTLEGEALGVDPLGRLMLRREDGETEHIMGGEVSLRSGEKYI